MDNLSLHKAIKLTKEYKKMVPKERVQLRKKRLYDLVTYARENSPLYHDLYDGLRDNFTLRDLPTTNRQLFLDNYDRWSTDSQVSSDSVDRYVQYYADQTDLYLGEYYVISNSGTDGSSIVTLYDSNSAMAMSTDYIHNIFARRENFWDFVNHGSRVAAIYTENGPFFPNVFSQMRRESLPARKKKSILLPAQASSADLVSRLNSFNPSMLAGFPSVLMRMADEKKAGRLKIEPAFIVADGEPLDKGTRKRLRKIFNCDVFSSYSTSMTGCIAYECREHHLHINDNWVLVEPVNAAGEPVKPGRPSDKVLITNLLSYPQPVIRYELGDRVIMHTKPCLCGNYSPWLEILGRSLDQIRFVYGGKEIIVPIADMDKVFKGADFIKRYQILIYPNNHLALRLTGAKGTDKTMAFFKAEKMLRSYMRSIGILAPMITLEKEDPQPHPQSGKYQTIIIMP